MEKVTIDYNRLCLELEKQGKTKADLSRDMTKNKNFVGLMEKNPDQPAEVERLMCLLLGLEQGSLIKQEEATGSQGEIKILENLHKEMREIHQAIIEYGELIEKIWSKVHANTLQLEKVKEDVKECAQVLKMTCLFFVYPTQITTIYKQLFTNIFQTYFPSIIPFNNRIYLS